MISDVNTERENIHKKTASIKENKKTNKIGRAHV